MTNPYLWFLAFTATVGILLIAMAVGAAIRDAFYRREAARRREQQGRQVSAEWLAILAATESTPIYDELFCEQIEIAEGWS